MKEKKKPSVLFQVSLVYLHLQFAKISVGASSILIPQAVFLFKLLDLAGLFHFLFVCLFLKSQRDRYIVLRLLVCDSKPVIIRARLLTEEWNLGLPCGWWHSGA